jgi:hypothetical protein
MRDLTETSRRLRRVYAALFCERCNPGAASIAGQGPYILQSLLILLLGACPLMRVFMHGKHGHGRTGPEKG